MSVGQYTKRYTVKRPVTEGDGGGGKRDLTPVTVATIWASQRAVSSRELAQAGAVQTLGTYQLSTHYTGDLATTQRLVPKGWTGPTLEIIGLRDPDGRRRVLWLDCVEAI